MNRCTAAHMWLKVLLRWSTQRGLSVIPKSNSQHRLQQNLDVTSFDLKEDEIQSISDLDKNLKFNVPTNVSDRTSNFPFDPFANGSPVRHPLLRLRISAQRRRNVRATDRRVSPASYQMQGPRNGVLRWPDNVGLQDSMCPSRKHVLQRDEKAIIQEHTHYRYVVQSTKYTNHRLVLELLSLFRRQLSHRVWLTDVY